MAEGWIALHRRTADHWLWEDKPFNRAAAWVDLLLTVNWQDGETVIKNQPFLCKRGESLRSYETWGKRWGWNKTATRRFLKLLEKNGMILIKNETVTIRVTVCKYETYQNVRNGSETQVKRIGNASETEVKTIEQGNNGTMKQEIPAELLKFQDFPEAWADWVKFRAEIKHKLTDTTIEAQLKKLAKMPDPVAVIRQSIENGWQGLFELKTNGQAKPKPILYNKL